MAKDRRCLDDQSWEVAAMASAETVMAVYSDREDKGLESRMRSKDSCPVWREGAGKVPDGNSPTPYEAVEKALNSLGYVRGKVSGPGVTLAQFLILLRAASRIGAAAVTLSELPVQAEDGPERAVDVRTQRLVAAEELETACRSVAAALLAGRGEVSLGPIQARITELIALLGEEAGEVLAYAQAMRHLESAAEALDTLYGGGRAHPRVRIGVRRPWPLADTLE